MKTAQKNIITALADGFTDAGCRFSFNYPGFHSNELHDALGGGTTSVNERSAYTMAWGASIAGARSVVSMKNVGLADAADPFLGSMILGCHAGMVLVVFDDCDLQHSQNRLDSRPWFDFYGGLWFDPLGIDHAYRIARRSFELSERFQVPVVIRITNILYDYSQHEHCRMSQVDSTSPVFQRDPARWVVHPSNAAGHEAAIQCRNKNIADAPGVCRFNGFAPALVRLRCEASARHLGHEPALYVAAPGKTASKASTVTNIGDCREARCVDCFGVG